jgi:Family of unknown function (DUF6159)
MTDPISRVERSWLLLRASWDVLRSDGDLLVLPAASAVATLVLMGGFAAEVISSGAYSDLTEAARAGDTARVLREWYPWAFMLYIAQYFIVIFFNTALVGAALERLNGGKPTVGSALSLAIRRIGPILGYAIISATIGMILKAVGERFGFIGRLIGAGVGIAWTLATFLVVPILAAEGLGPVDAIYKSSALLKKTWGENLIGNAGISLVLGLIAAAIAIVGIGGGVAAYQGGLKALAIPLLSLSIASLIVLLLLGAALTAAYTAAVYYYAVNGQPPADFGKNLIGSAFAPKGS